VDRAASVPEITTDLVAEFGDEVPPTLISSTVEAAALSSSPYPDEPDLRRRAREDVSALADAMRRSATA